MERPAGTFALSARRLPRTVAEPFGPGVLIVEPRFIAELGVSALGRASTDFGGSRIGLTGLGIPGNREPRPAD